MCCQLACGSVELSHIKLCCDACNFSVLQIQSEGKDSKKRTQEKLSLSCFLGVFMGELVKGSTDSTK